VAGKIQFGEFALEADTRRLTRGDMDLHLSPKAFQLLSLLLQARPAVLDRATLRRHLWPDTHVVDASLGNLVSEIRGALGDSASGAPWVRTVHGVGYAFSGDARDAPGARSDTGAGGAARCWLIWAERPLPLDQPENTVGRDPACTVWIDAPGVSRRHARIVVTGGADAVASIEDLGSTNGTYLGGLRVAGTAVLGDGDILTLGEAVLTFRASRRIETPTKRVSPPAI
jgi:DNA-binding winged helix-turn-helix (wHTH) protein